MRKRTVLWIAAAVLAIVAADMGNDELQARLRWRRAQQFRQAPATAPADVNPWDQPRDWPPDKLHAYMELRR